MTLPLRQDPLVRRFVIGLVSVVCAAVLLALAGLPFYVFPATDDADGVDAVMVLGPPGEDRFTVARRISAENGGAPIVVSAPATGVDSVPVLGICRDEGVICRTPDPFSTLGEAVLVRDLAAQHGWQRIAVVTSTTHVSRARFIVGQCFSGEVRMVSSGAAAEGAAWWVGQYLYQTAGFVKALFTPC